MSKANAEYAGSQVNGETRVTKNGIHFSAMPSQMVRRFANGFGWGASTRAATQLALAILHDVTGDKQIALAFCESYRAEVIAKLPVIAFTLHAQDVRDWLQALTVAEGASRD